MTKPKVLFIGDLNRELKEYKEFQKKFECIDYSLTTQDQLVDDFQNKFKNIEGIYGAWLGFFLLGGFRDKILESAPKTLKVISICSVGYDGYDGVEMAKRGIVLTNVPSIGASEPVADLVLYKTLAAFRNFTHVQLAITPETNHVVQFRKRTDSNKYDEENGRVIHGDPHGYSFGHYVGGRQNLSPKGHNVVIIGFGGIGKTIGQRLANIGMNVHYIKRTKLLEEEESNLGYKATFCKSLDQAKDFADLIVIACPGTPDTYHMINEKVIQNHTKPFRIINIGRGSIIDESALVKGLKSGKILFAGLDVFEEEPKIHPDLLHRKDVILTPHIGASTVENFDFTSIQAMKNLEDVLLNGGEGINRVN